MKGLAKSYGRELRVERRMWPAWPPDEPVEPGAFGYIEDGLFVPQGHLRDLGVEVRAANSLAQANETYASSGTVVFSTHAHAELDVGDIPIEPGVEIEVTFNRRYGIFLLLTGCGVSRIGNLLQIAREIASLNATGGGWDPKWHVVSAARTADRGAIAVSNAKEASVRLSLYGDIEGADASINFKFSRTRSLGLQVAARGLLTPLLEVRRVYTEARVPVMRGGTQTQYVAASGIALVEVPPDPDLTD